MVCASKCVLCVFSFPVAVCVAVAVCGTCYRVCIYYRYVYQLPRVDTVVSGSKGLQGPWSCERDGGLFSP